MKEEILNILDMQDILNKYGIKMNKMMCHCPFHNDKTASMKIYKKSFYCFGCNKTGDIIQFIQYLYNLSFKEAMQKINIDFNLGLSNNIKINYDKIKKIQQEREKKQKEEYLKNISFQEKCDLLHIYNKYIKYLNTKINKNNWETLTYTISYLSERALLLEEEIDYIYIK